MVKKVEKALDWKSIQKEAKELDKYSKHYINEEKTEFVKYKSKFSESTIMELIVELVKKIEYNKEKQFGFFNNYLEIKTYVNFLIIKYFTDLKEDFSNSTLSEDIKMLEILGSTGKFKLIYEAFDTTEVNKVHSKIDEIADLMDDVEVLSAMTTGKLKLALQNEEVREKFKLNPLDK